MITETELQEIDRITEQAHDPFTPALECSREALWLAVKELHEQVQFLLNLRRLQDEVNSGRASLIKALHEANDGLRARNVTAERDLAAANARIATILGGADAPASLYGAAPVPPASPARMTEAQHNAYPNGRWQAKPAPTP